MDASSAQLASELRASVIESLQTRRPLLHHLNADTSWLLQIPRPQTTVKRNGRRWFNVLIDPWLSGSQSDVASWFSQQWHATESTFASVAAVEELAKKMEQMTAEQDVVGMNETWSEAEDEGVMDSPIDVVVISHEFTDHCHKETLLTVNKNIPVIATAKAFELIKSWNHFRTILETPAFSASQDWRDIALPPLPDWLGIARLVTKNDLLYYHSAIMIVFQSDVKNGELADEDGSAEAIIYTPHGIHPPDLAVVAKASPPIEALAFLHGLHDVKFGQQLNLGAHNGLQAQRVLKAKYWIGTHDEVKTAGGLVSWFLQRKVITLKEALEQESSKEVNLDEKTSSLRQLIQDIEFVDVQNGQSVMLT